VTVALLVVVAAPALEPVGQVRLGYKSEMLGIGVGVAVGHALVKLRYVDPYDKAGYPLRLTHRVYS